MSDVDTDDHNDRFESLFEAAANVLFETATDGSGGKAIADLISWYILDSGSWAMGDILYWIGKGTALGYTDLKDLVNEQYLSTENLEHGSDMHRQCLRLSDLAEQTKGIDSANRWLLLALKFVDADWAKPGKKEQADRRRYSIHHQLATNYLVHETHCPADLDKGVHHFELSLSVDASLSVDNVDRVAKLYFVDQVLLDPKTHHLISSVLDRHFPARGGSEDGAAHVFGNRWTECVGRLFSHLTLETKMIVFDEIVCSSTPPGPYPFDDGMYYDRQRDLDNIRNAVLDHCVTDLPKDLCLLVGSYLTWFNRLPQPCARDTGDINYSKRIKLKLNTIQCFYSQWHY